MWPRGYNVSRTSWRGGLTKEAAMRDDPSGHEPRTIWQNQPTEPSAMTLEKIRQKVRELHAKTRRQLLGNLVVPLIVVAFYGFCIKQFHHPVLHLMFAFAIAWSLAGVYFLNRGMWSAMLPGDAALSTGLQSYRRVVGRRGSLPSRLRLFGVESLRFATSTLIVILLPP